MSFSLACYTSGTGSLLGHWRQQGLLDTTDEIAALLDLHLDHSRTRTGRLIAWSRALISKLADADVPVIILKGGHTGPVYFPDPALRPSSDLDLLVPSADAARAEALLRGIGLTCSERAKRESTWVHRSEPGGPRSLWLVHAEDPFPVDLHSSLDFEANPGASKVYLESAKPFDSACRWPINPDASVLEQPLLLLHLAVHASGGLHSLTLLRLIEIVLVIRRDERENRLSWDEFVELAERTGGLGASYPALRMAEKLAQGTIPSRVLIRCKAAAPQRVRAVVERLNPGTAHRVSRASTTEHFMWVTGAGGWIRQLSSDLALESRSFRQLWTIYEARLYRMLRGRITR